MKPTPSLMVANANKITNIQKYTTFSFHVNRKARNFDIKLDRADVYSFEKNLGKNKRRSK
jgi:hypothetical protein